MSTHRQKIGAWGENVAADYLEQQSYELIARNVRTPYGEIDIVAKKEGRSAGDLSYATQAGAHDLGSRALRTRKRD